MICSIVERRKHFEEVNAEHSRLRSRAERLIIIKIGLTIVYVKGVRQMSLKKGNSAAAAGAVATLAILSIAVLVMVRKYGR